MNEKSLSDLKRIYSMRDGLEIRLKNRGVAPDLPLRTMPELSDKIWGLHRQKLCIVGARTSNCKSQLCINFAYDLASHGKNVLFLSLEMPILAIMERMFCCAMTIDNLELLKGGYNNSGEIKKKFNEFIEKTRTYKLILSDCIGKDWEFVEYALTHFQQKPDVVIIDHIQEIRGGQSQKESIDKYISTIRESAIRNNFALIVCSQVNRISQNDKSNEPQLHHLKATGFLEESADQVILLHWPWFYDNNQNKNVISVNVAKNRDGMTGYLNMSYYPEYCQIRDLNYVPVKDLAESVSWA